MRWKESVIIIHAIFFLKKKKKKEKKTIVSLQIITYCTAHEGWDFIGYQGLFCPWNKPSCDRSPEGCSQSKVVTFN